ncbi:hypothetical protein B9Z55_007512 [Caenorhabditis nigoni]|uniref:Uncharacterized protein n=1 Tax=Caenorhabditis nigoni TaxID=1611254 RepID=A0A2G5VA60_9PELO|nr:hypothetical protein B9Z55_007512 [Caenorhabditis nigoni]
MCFWLQNYHWWFRSMHHVTVPRGYPEGVRRSVGAAPGIQYSSSRAQAPELQLQSSSSRAPAPELQIQSSSSRAPAPAGPGSRLLAPAGAPFSEAQRRKN